MIAIIDYGVGNLFSLCSSFSFIGKDAVITNDEKVIADSERIILPGVGAFEDAAKKLRESGMADTVRSEVKKGKPLLGICLGMQLLFDKSFEYGEHEGLSLINGNVVPMSNVIPPELKIPQIGWNALHFPKDKPKSRLFKYIEENEHVYFVHSYYAADCEKDTIATTEYGAEITAAAAYENVFGTQFHPEKSGNTGLNILRAFCEL
ncbi:MAG: imidazole glycerol phosphate synthase subunit HisH [Clostridiales bacterium]|nr:imidazole glycerol phosphate synthase subunit HisH [Clostridiales bacterium]